MLRRLAVVTLLASGAACSTLIGLKGDYSVAPADGGVPIEADEAGDAAPDEQIVRPIEGSITVHVAQPATGAQAFALVGDGTKIAPQEVTTDKVTLSDPSLKNGETVTLVRRLSGSPTTFQITTLVGVARADVYFGTWQDAQRSGTIAGRVREAGATDNLHLSTDKRTVRTVSAQFDVTGAFRADTEGAGDAVRAVVYRTISPTSDVVLAAGASTPISVQGGATVTSDVELNHGLDGGVGFMLSGMAPYGSTVATEVGAFPEPPPAAPLFFRRSNYIAGSDAGPTASIVMTTLALNGDFSSWSQYVRTRVRASASPELPNAEVWFRYADAVFPTINLPVPIALIQPARDSGPLATIPRENFTIEYGPTPVVSTLVVIELVGTSADGKTKFDWNVIMPAPGINHGSFVPFTLPKHIAPETLPAGTYSATVKAFTTYDTQNVNEIFGGPPGATDVEGLIRATRVRADIASSGAQRFKLP